MMLCGWQAGLVALWQLLLLCDRLILWLLLLTLRLRSGRFDVQIPLEATEGGAEREGKRRREREKKCCDNHHGGTPWRLAWWRETGDALDRRDFDAGSNLSGREMWELSLQVFCDAISECCGGKSSVMRSVSAVVASLRWCPYVWGFALGLRLKCHE